MVYLSQKENFTNFRKDSISCRDRREARTERRWRPKPVWGDEIAALQAKLGPLAEEEKTLTQEIADRQARLKAVQREIRRSLKTLEKKEALKAVVDERQAEIDRQEALRDAVQQLIEEGFTPQQILKKLGK